MHSCSLVSSITANKQNTKEEHCDLTKVGTYHSQHEHFTPKNRTYTSMLFSKVMRVSNHLSTLMLVGTLLLTRLSHTLAQSPVNDKCSAATAISSIPFSLNGIDTSLATSDVNTTICSVTATDVGVWFSFLGNNKIVKIALTNPTFNAKIAVFSGTCNVLTCVDDSSSADTLTWQAALNVPYLIFVSGLSQSKGTFNMQVSDVPRPPNDSCENAVAITSNAIPQGYDSTGAFTDFTATTCTVNSLSRGIWFKFTPASDRIYTVATSAATFFHNLVIFTGTSCGNLACFDSITGGQFFAPALQITWAGKAGQAYYILVTGFGAFSYVGTFTIAISDIPRPKNDDCVTAIEVVSSNTTKNGDTSGSFVDLIVGPQCTISTTARGSWYFFVGGGGTVRAAISDAVFNAKLIVFSGPCNNVGCIGNNDGPGTTAVVTFPTVVGVKYYLLVTGNGFFDIGTFVLTVSGDVRGPTISPTVKPVTLPPNKVPVPVSPSAPVVTPPSPIIAPIVAPSEPPLGFFRRLFRALFGWIFN